MSTRKCSRMLSASPSSIGKMGKEEGNQGQEEAICSLQAFSCHSFHSTMSDYFLRVEPGLGWNAKALKMFF